MPKPTAFISHINEELKVACYLKEFIDRRFLRTVDVFVSSHEDSVGLGDDWLNAVKDSLSSCGLMVVICSPISVNRPWINFEAGAGWIRAIPVVPLCHSGMSPGQLPAPLNTRQAGLLGNAADMQKLFGRLATLADIDAPKADDKEYFACVADFETNSRANVLLKDTTFIANLLRGNVESLEYFIYASTKDYDFLSTLDLSQAQLENHSFTFNDVYRLFNASMLFSSLQRKVYQVIQTTVLQLAENIRFILSNSHLKIAPELEDLFSRFLYTLGQVDNWANGIRMVDQTRAADDGIREMIISSIKETKLPPIKKPSNVINVIIDYYDSLVFYKGWLAEYKSTVARLTGFKLPAP